MADNSLKEIEQLVNDYSKAFEKLILQKEEIKEYYDGKWEKIKDEIKDPKEIKAVQDAIDGVKKQIDGGDNDLETLEGDESKDSILKCEIEKETAENEVKKAQKNFDKLKELQKNKENDVKELDDLRKFIEAEEEKSGKFINANVRALTLYLKNSLDSISIKEKDKFEMELNIVWKELGKAKKDLDKAVKELKEKTDKRDELKKKLEDGKKNYKDEILVAVRNALLDLSSSPSQPKIQENK